MEIFDLIYYFAVTIILLYVLLGGMMGFEIVNMVIGDKLKGLKPGFKQCQNKSEVKSILITGTTRGIGKALEKMAVRDHLNVTTCNRNIVKNPQVMKQLRIDFSDMKSIVAGLDEISKTNQIFDSVIVNHGLIVSDSRETVDGLEIMHAANYLGPYLFIERLLKENRIKKRIVLVSSHSHTEVKKVDFTKLEKVFKMSLTQAVMEYGHSKYCLSTYGIKLQEMLKESEGEQKNLDVFTVCPGPVKTSLGRETPIILKQILDVFMYFFFRHAEEGALPIYQIATDTYFNEKGGNYYKMEEKMELFPLATDPKLQNDLIRTTKKVLKEFL